MIRLLVGLLAISQTTIQPTVVSPDEWSHYDARRASAPIAIDGAVTEKEWAKAGKITQWSDLVQPEWPLMNPTTARMLWDDDYFYLAFECADDDIWGTMTKPDDFIFIEEVAEIYIDPEGKGRHYWEIEISPRNTVLDIMVPMAGWEVLAPTTCKYDVIGLRSAVKVYGTLDDRTDKDEKWTVEMAIPWSEFKGRKVNVPPRDGDSWRIQLFRIERPGPYPAEEQVVSWSKSPGVYHEPRNFGVVTFWR